MLVTTFVSTISVRTFVAHVLIVVTNIILKENKNEKQNLHHQRKQENENEKQKLHHQRRQENEKRKAKAMYHQRKQKQKAEQNQLL